ncbi:ROK family protein [Nocardia sp. alder85J]|uniref:ROK family protein n=1 Tax=Nocardia sp. alder85J TaxID=2862949 RepID=UPI001CD397E5|nr:ROK family protein [Nocardia sp. alder85J]MCX4092162.1 ROK family protein [Nocardia sp. alder85J]
MTMLALEIGSAGFAVSRLDDDVDDEDVLRAPAPARGAWQQCREMLLKAAGGQQVTAVGIGSSGPIDMSAGVIAPGDIAEWRAGFGIVEEMRRLFPSAEVRLGIDGVCIALAERNFGAVGQVMDALSISASYHITGGISVGGFAVVGRTGNAGNIGHVLVPGFDELCDCGGRGCVDAVAGGLAAVRFAREQGWTGTTPADLVTAAGTGDEAAVAALTRAGTALGRAIASVAALLDLDLVVVGGVLAQPGSALWQPMQEAVATHARASYLHGLRVVLSPLGEFGVLAGAGVLAVTANQD